MTVSSILRISVLGRRKAMAALLVAGSAAVLASALLHARAGWAATAAVPAGVASATRAASAPRAAPATPFYATAFERKPDAAALTALGRQLFRETALSGSGRMSCASCHDPVHAYGPANALAVQLGGPGGGGLPGLRAVPSLMYRQTTPPFSEHFFDNDGNDAEDQGPTGGFDWDGRASSAHEQAEAPLLSPFEMANTDRTAVLRRLSASGSAAAMRDTFGPHVFEHGALAWNGLVLALEVFQQSPRDFAPFSSRYDAYLRGKAVLTPAEARGLQLFNDKAKGNCASCHPSEVKRGAFPLFTDMGHIALGVPRNAAIPANRQPAWFDLGLCGPLREDLKQHPEYCGLFKTPSLRNVATRRVFFHNGAAKGLDEAVRFYVQRDVHPERFYPRDAHGHVHKYNDLPVAYQDNINTDPPFGGSPGGKPVMTEREIADVVAFLKTLTDAPVPAPSAEPAAAHANAGLPKR